MEPIRIVGRGCKYFFAYSNNIRVFIFITTLAKRTKVFFSQ